MILTNIDKIIETAKAIPLRRRQHATARPPGSPVGQEAPHRRSGEVMRR